MNQKYILIAGAVVLVIGGVVAFMALSGDKADISTDSQVENVASENSTESIEVKPTVSVKPSSGFAEILAFEAEGKDYTLGPIPAHFWKLDGDTKLLAEHFNGSDPFAWASDVPTDTLLYEVEGTLGSCSNGYLKDKPEENGYVHFHGSNEDSDIGFWLKHTTVTAFTWEGPPGNPLLGSEVPAGVDLNFPNICEFPAG